MAGLFGNVVKCGSRIWRRNLSLGLALGLGCLGLCAAVAHAEPPKLLPTPKSVNVTGGEMPLAAASRIVAADPKLKPLAGILSGEIRALTRLRLEPAEGEAKPGDIVLKINPQLRADEEILTVQNRNIVKTRDYAHTINVSDKAVVEGWDYRACCEGTATILQALKETGGAWSLPKLQVKDWPHADYTGIMIDCVRQDMPIVAVKDAVMAARFWKVRYLHLHLMEDSAFIFPMKAFKSGTANGACFNGDTPRVWDLEELKKLAAFADARGVTLVPELEAPAHCGALLRDRPDLASSRTLDITNDNAYVVLNQIVGEMCEVFKSSPYFHVGGDEVDFAFVPRLHAWTAEFMKKNNLKTIHNEGKDEYLKYYATFMNRIVKKHGRVMIFWGGHQSLPQAREYNDAVAYSWYQGALQAQSVGMATITVPWEIKVPFREWSMYNSNGEVLDRTKHRVLGASRPMWEQSAETIVNRWLGGMAERQERTWGPDTKVVDDEFRAREKAAQARMNKLVRPVEIKEDVKVTERAGERQIYAEPATITLTADVPAGCRIHYTVDGTEPKATSAVYEKPLKLTGRLRVRAALLDESGRTVGGVNFGEKYEYRGP